MNNNNNNTSENSDEEPSIPRRSSIISISSNVEGLSSSCIGKVTITIAQHYIVRNFIIFTKISEFNIDNVKMKHLQDLIDLEEPDDFSQPLHLRLKVFETTEHCIMFEGPHAK
ncbi:CFC_HP_G0057200.mRNA.1.CDS.1 [Saccharomyces cerevisiae]|nr:CFC_HP_G0057200.mRNA.1.CDS.1 [Saccharomyces cerevisiae]CAI6540471.1 CFC_HP_G0057200.mRNA.1.CDS.1 [Saccharomyces cerevisiae]